MKKKILSFLGIFILAFSLQTFSQKSLKLTSIHSGREEIVRPNTELIYRLKSDSDFATRHGKLTTVSDSTIVIDDQVIPISELKVVAIHSRDSEHAANAAGVVGRGLIIAGDIVTHVGLNIFVDNDFYIWPVGGTVAFVGACIWGLGLIMDGIVEPAINDAPRKTHADNWKAEIIDNHSSKKKKNKSVDDDLYGY